MPEKICPYCDESFDANSLETESCRKTKCVKANQRAKKRLAAGVVEVKRGRPKSHVAMLKQRTKERILGKAEGHSIALPASSDASDSDVPPVKGVHGTNGPCGGPEGINSPPPASIFYREMTEGEKGTVPDGVGFDPAFKAGGDKSVEVSGEFRECEHGRIFIPTGKKDAFKHFEDQVFPVTDIKHWPPYTPPTIEDSTSINQQAKAVISKVPTCKPESELARLGKSQLKNTKKKA